MLDAFSKLNDKSVGLLVLSTLSSTEGEAYRRKVRELGLEGDTQMYDGWVDEDLKKALFCASDVVCVPSLYAPASAIALEALAASLACEQNGFVGPALVVARGRRAQDAGDEASAAAEQEEGEAGRRFVARRGPRGGVVRARPRERVRVAARPADEPRRRRRQARRSENRLGVSSPSRLPAGRPGVSLRRSPHHRRRHPRARRRRGHPRAPPTADRGAPDREGEESGVRRDVSPGAVLLARLIGA